MAGGASSTEWYSDVAPQDVGWDRKCLVGEKTKHPGFFEGNESKRTLRDCLLVFISTLFVFLIVIKFIMSASSKILVKLLEYLDYAACIRS